MNPILKSISVILADTRPLSPADVKRGQALIAKREARNAEREAAAWRLQNLPTARPGFRPDSTIGNVALQMGETYFSEKRLAKAEEKYWSDRRVTTLAGIEDVENYALMKGNAIAAEGRRVKANLDKIATMLSAKFPASHKARQFGTALRGLDTQAVFVLARTGFYDRLREILGNEEKGVLDTLSILNAFTEDFDDELWDELITEMRNAKMYNKRNLTL